MRRRPIDGVRLSFLTAGFLVGVVIAVVGVSHDLEKELLSSLVGLFATLSGFILTVQTIAISSASAHDNARKNEVLFRVKRLYFFFITNIVAAATATGALALRGFSGPLPDAVNMWLLFIAPFALITAVELPRTLWSSHQ